MLPKPTTLNPKPPTLLVDLTFGLQIGLAAGKRSSKNVKSETPKPQTLNDEDLRVPRGPHADAVRGGSESRVGSRGQDSKLQSETPKLPTDENAV